MKITLSQKRFLIIWCCFHITGILTNKLRIEGAIRNKYWSPVFNVFTTPQQNHDGQLWPFVTFGGWGNYIFLQRSSPDDAYFYKYFDRNEKWNNFFGIFNGYDWNAFVLWMIVGFAIVFIPKIWNDNRPTP